MKADEMTARLTEWLAGQLPAGDDVRVEGLDRVPMGHSAETMLLTLAWREADDERRRDVVVRLRPPAPGLLEPYDLRRQFDILRALEPTSVRSPRVYWFEPSGDVLGREFYVMERLGGTVYEQGVPEELEAAPGRLARMSGSLVDSLAAIHLVDLARTGLGFLGDGADFLERELDRWDGEVQRVRRGPLPALERLGAEVRERRPEQSPTVTLVHGDPKPGNFAFADDEVSAVFDWEMTAVGDPLADIGWAEINWTTPGSFTGRRGALTPDEFVARYEAITGITVVHREWYRAFQGYKMVVIMLVASMLFDEGFTDDLRFAYMGMAVHPYTLNALADLGVEDAPEPGPVAAREERIREVRERS